MRSKESTGRRLQLRRETLRSLRAADLARVAGGSEGWVFLTDNCIPLEEDPQSLSTVSRYC